MVVTIIPYNTIFTLGYSNYINYVTIRNNYTEILNAFINICKYLHKFASCMVLFTFIRLQNDIADGDRANTFLMYFLRASLKRGHINKK